MRILLETFALTAAMAAPYLLLDHHWATLIAGIILFVAAVWPAWVIERADRVLPRRPAKVVLLDMGFLQSVPLMVVGVTTAAVLGWLDWAYRIDIVPQHSLRVAWQVAGGLVLVPLLFLALARPLGKCGAANEFLAAVRRKGFGHFHTFWLSGTALDCAVFCLVVFYFVGRAAGDLTTLLNDGEGLPVWELLKAFPLLPLGLVGSAACLALSRAIGRDGLSARGTYQAYITKTDDQRPAGEKANTRAGIAVLSSWGITLFVVLYPLHLALVLATSTVAGLESLGETVQAVERWTEEQRTSGRTDLQIARLLDQHGRWSADPAESGLPALLPGLEAVLRREHGSGIGQCRVTVAAGASAAALVREVDWQEEQPASSELRYCVRVACPSPAVWAAPAPVVLFSNQASHKEQWSRYLFLDLRAQGRAPVPGGNCTAEGALADHFQG